MRERWVGVVEIDRCIEIVVYTKREHAYAHVLTCTR